MRFRLPLGRSLFFLCAFLLALVATIPLRLGLAWLDLDERGVAAREARGSVWGGALVESQFGEAALGDLDAGLGFFPLLLGRARISVGREAGDGADQFRGAFSVAGADFGIDDLRGRLTATELFAPLPVAALDLDDVTAHFENGLCVEAEGAVRAELAAAPAGLTLPSSLAGNARCDEGALLLPMIGQSGMEQLNLRIDASGGYVLELAVRASDDAMRERLAAAGLVPGPHGYAMSISGSF